MIGCASRHHHFDPVCDYGYVSSLGADFTDKARRAELARIRQIFIPDLVFRLHALLANHHAHAPSLLQQALNLVKIVADEGNHVYAEFFGRGSDPYRLTAYLDKVRSASLLALQASGTPFAVVVK
jgi:nuclear pore complex protein Nup107